MNLRGAKESGRAFASGCTALTGVEAVSNGVPAFAGPKSRNAASTLVIMGVLATTMFAGITALAPAAHVHMAEDTSALVCPICWLPRLRALAFAEATRPATLVAVKVSAEDVQDTLPAEWEDRGVPVPLVVIESPYRETVRPVLRYVGHLRREYPGDVISVVIPEYVVAHWWQHLLHNQTAQ